MHSWKAKKKRIRLCLAKFNVSFRSITDYCSVTSAYHFYASTIWEDGYGKPSNSLYILHSFTTKYRFCSFWHALIRGGGRVIGAASLVDPCMSHGTVQLKPLPIWLSWGKIIRIRLFVFVYSVIRFSFIRIFSFIRKHSFIRKLS